MRKYLIELHFKDLKAITAGYSSSSFYLALFYQNG